MSDPSHRLRITRRFDASPERVFDAFLNPQIARKWLFTAPETDMAARRVEIDARVGGKWLMTNPCQGMELEGIGDYLEIDRPRPLVFERFHVPKYVGHHGWVGLWLDLPDIDWSEIGDLLADAYRMTAPKTLVARI